MRIHGHAVHGARTPTYNSWRKMMERCHNKNCHKYPSYGGAGITVDESWHNYLYFLADMGPRPPGTTLDRHPNPWGNYEPGNCRWATQQQQIWNRRINPFEGL